MILDQEGHTSVITQDNTSLPELVLKIQDIYSKIKNNNIIVNLTSLNKVSLEDILVFSDLSEKHRNLSHSMVIVCGEISIDDVPDELIIVPTLQEAHDIVEMEEMERDLGF